MELLGAVDMLGLCAAVAALLFWALGRGCGLRRDTALLLGALLLLTAFLNLNNALQGLGIGAQLDPVVDYLEVLHPLLWGFFAYSFVQSSLQKQLARSERRNRLLLSHLPQCIYLKDRELVYVSANDAFAEQVGSSPEEIAGKTDFDLFPEEVAERRREEDFRAMERGQPETKLRQEGAPGAESVLEVTRIPLPGEEDEFGGLLVVVNDITETRYVRRALERAETEKAAILDSMSEVVCYLDAEMNLLWANEAVEEFADRPVEQIVGQRCYETWHDRDTPCPECPAGEALETGQPHEGNIRGPEDRTWRLRAYPMFGPDEEVIGVVEVAQDLTEKKLARDATAQLAAIVEASDDAIIGLSTNGTIRNWNPGAERIYGYTAEHVLGKSVEMLAFGEQRADLARVVQKAAEGESVQHHETVTETRDGRSIDVSLTLSPIFSGGEVTGISAIARDITAEAALREELRMLSLVDTLTELYNRRGFFHLAQQQMKIARRTEQPLMLFYADMDGLKQINDRYGHGTGDKAINEVADILLDTFRESDIVARMGGDEFAVMALHTGEKHQQELRERLSRRIQEKNQDESRPYELSVSFGVTTYDPKEPRALDELIADADTRMYERKEAKKRSRSRSTER